MNNSAKLHTYNRNFPRTTPAKAEPSAKPTADPFFLTFLNDFKQIT